MTGPRPSPIEEQRKSAPCEPSLYCDDRELHRRLAPHMGWDAFKAAIKVAEERDGFPGISSRWRGRNWAKVQKWIANDEGMSGNASLTSAQDGPENFNDAPPRIKARIQDRPQRSPLLDRQPGHARPDGISRSLHPVAGGRR